MSLDVYLEVPVPIKCEPGSGIFIREEGQTKEISREEWDQRNPSREPIVFKRDDTETNEVYHGNITHNLGRMAIEAGLYAVLWEPETRGWVLAKDLIASLERGLARLRLNPSYFKRFNPQNGWGNYELLVRFTEEYLAACCEWPNAIVKVSR